MGTDLGWTQWNHSLLLQLIYNCIQIVNLQSVYMDALIETYIIAEMMKSAFWVLLEIPSNRTLLAQRFKELNVCISKFHKGRVHSMLRLSLST